MIINYNLNLLCSVLKIDFEIHSTIFAHSIFNPPTERVGCNIDLKVVNGIELSLLKHKWSDKFRLPTKTGYDLKILNPLSIGFHAGEKSQTTQELKNLILAMNLGLCKSSITDSNIVFSSQDIKFKPTGLENAIILSDDYNVGTSMSENINEKFVLEAFEKLQKLDRSNILPNNPRINLIKSLNEYEIAMREFSRPFIFKHLFNALELAINFSLEMSGSKFDSFVEARTGIPAQTVEIWREFYNRIKHVDKSSQHNTTYLEGMKKVTSMILPVRNSARKAIVPILINV